MPVLYVSDLMALMAEYDASYAKAQEDAALEIWLSMTYHWNGWQVEHRNGQPDWLFFIYAPFHIKQRFS